MSFAQYSVYATATHNVYRATGCRRRRLCCSCGTYQNSLFAILECVLNGFDTANTDPLNGINPNKSEWVNSRVWTHLRVARHEIPKTMLNKRKILVLLAANASISVEREIISSSVSTSIVLNYTSRSSSSTAITTAAETSTTSKRAVELFSFWAWLFSCVRIRASIVLNTNEAYSAFRAGMLSANKTADCVVWQLLMCRTWNPVLR